MWKDKQKHFLYFESLDKYERPRLENVLISISHYTLTTSQPNYTSCHFKSSKQFLFPITHLLHPSQITLHVIFKSSKQKSFFCHQGVQGPTDKQDQREKKGRAFGWSSFSQIRPDLMSGGIFSLSQEGIKYSLLLRLERQEIDYSTTNKLSVTIGQQLLLLQRHHYLWYVIYVRRGSYYY